MSRLSTALMRVRSNLELLYYVGTHSLVLSAGMPRSGSTLLFNMIRNCLEYRYGDRVASGWIDDVKQIPQGSHYLLKSHNVDRVMALRSHAYFYSYRDVRDALVSSKRKFAQEPSIEYCRYYISGYITAERYATAMFKYEEFAANARPAIKVILKHLDIIAEVDEILDQLPELGELTGSEHNYDRKTLMHGKHATHTVAGEWREILQDSLLSQIHDEFGWWFEKHGYPLS